MASMKLAEQLEEQPSATKPRIDNAEEQEEIGSSDESDLPKSTELKDEVLENSTMDLPSSRVPLPLELNCEIFKCLKLPVQKKFIWGLGRDIYGIFGPKLLKKTKRVLNQHGNRWDGTTTTATVAANGLSVRNEVGSPNVFAEQSFPISGPHCRADDFPGTILYYYEIKSDLLVCDLGLSHAIPDNSFVGEYSNSYAISISIGHPCHVCWLAGEPHFFELPEGAVEPEVKENGNVFGCGLVLDPEDNLAIFFALNGKLLGRKIPISPTVDRLFPAVTIWMKDSFEANFGDDSAKPFVYDIKNCPGLGLACI